MRPPQLPRLTRAAPLHHWTEYEAPDWIVIEYGRYTNGAHYVYTESVRGRYATEQEAQARLDAIRHELHITPPKPLTIEEL